MRRVIRASLSDVVAFAGPLALYGATLVPGVAFWDTGEMQTVPAILGIAHPTGFPAFVLLGFAFENGVPLGTPAWRLSLFSALAAAGAAWLSYRFARGIVRERWIAVAAAGAYAVGDVVWTRAIRAEVHDVALFFTALALVAAAEAGRRRSGRLALVAAFACGLGLATHPVTALALPSVVVLGWPSLRRAGLRGTASLLAAACAPLALYAYVPLRSAYIEAHGLDPATALGLRGGAFWNYDAPATPERFARYVSGASFHPAAAFAALLTRTGLANVLAFARLVGVLEYGSVMLALAALGFVYLALRERRVALAFGLLVLLSAGFVPNFAAESDRLRYALPALWIVGACAGIGAWWFAYALVRERGALAALLSSALLAIALWPNVAYAARAVALERQMDDASSLVASVVARTPDDALIVASWAYAAPLAYAAYVAHAFGRRRIVSGWPSQYRGRSRAWQREFAHIYFVLPSRYDVAPLGRRIFATRRWQLAQSHG